LGEAMFDNLSANMKAAIFTAFVGAVGGGGTLIYNIGFNNGARDLATVESFGKKLPILIDDIDKVSKALAEKTDLIDRNQKLVKEAADATSERQKFEDLAKKQTKDLEEKEKRIADLNSLVEKAFPPEEIKVSIGQGTAERVIPNLLTIGVNSAYGTSVVAYVNGQYTTFYPGDPKKLQLGDRNCTIELVQAANPASFIVTCSKK
jgi:hypothetical protein